MKKKRQKIKSFAINCYMTSKAMTQILSVYIYTCGFPYISDGKESACNTGDPGSITGSGRSPGEGNAINFSVLAWKIPRTEGPDGLQSMGPQRVGHD